jgi:hypothetical protein
MKQETTVVADAVNTTFTLSAEQVETVSFAAEMAQDATYDFSKACETIAAVFGAMKAQGVLNYASWTVVADAFKKAATVRARDNGVIDPEGAAGDCWDRVVSRNKDIHGLTKPKAENKDAKRMAEKREAEKAKAVEAAQGKSVAELEAAKRELYSQASDESIAKAKALEKVIKVVQSAEKDAVSAQMKPLVAAAGEAHKAIMEFMKDKNDPKLMGDYVILLKRTLDIWQGK